VLVAGAAGAGDHLLDDLAGGQVALEPGLAGGAEPAAHGAARLGRHAHGRAVAVVHEHGLDPGAVGQGEQPLDGLAAVADRLGRRGEGGGQLGVEPGAQRLGQRRQLARGGQLLVQPRPHLVDAVAGLPVEHPGEPVSGEVVPRRHVVRG
jgi:hypothetical protein